MTTREVLTLQFGHYSNFIGTHWWNVQELAFQYAPSARTEINNDVLYREGQTQNGGITFTPRVLLVDLKGSLKSLPELGELYEPLPEPTKTCVPWHGDLVDIKKQPQEPKNEYRQDLDKAVEPTLLSEAKYNLERTVNVWSDFLYTRFHPRTVNVVNEYTHDNENVPFDLFPLGSSLWKKEQFQEDFIDKIRNYVEECDSFQGFQILTDATNAFGGLSLGCMEHIKDEYERKSVLAIPVLPSSYSDYSHTNDEELRASQIKDCIRVLNVALSFEGLAENSSLFVPLCASKSGWRKPGQQRLFHRVNYDDKLAYHTSAILASALDTFTLKYRLSTSHFALSDLCADLNNHGRKAAAASLCLPFSINQDAYFIDCLDNWEGPLSQSITPSCNIGTDRQMQVVTLRGLPEGRLKLSGPSRHVDMPAYKCNTFDEMLTFYYSCMCFGTASNVTTISKGLHVGMPYPNIFDQYVGVDGYIQADARPEHMRPNSVPVLAGLHSGKEVGEMLEMLHTEARRVKPNKFHQYFSAGLDADSFTECLDHLFDLRECYEDNYLL